MNVSQPPLYTGHRIVGIFCTGVLLLLLLVRPSLANDLDSRLALLDEKTQHINSVTVDFQEEVFTPMLKKPLLSKGVIYIKGNRSHWKTLEPVPISLYTGHENIAIYYPNRNTVEMYALDRQLRSLVISPLPKLSTLQRSFIIAQCPHTQTSPPHMLTLQLTPKNESIREFIEELFVRIDEKLGLANRVEIVDADGDRTVIEFTNIRTNVNVTDAQVELQVPDDVTTVYPLGRVNSGDSSKTEGLP